MTRRIPEAALLVTILVLAAGLRLGNLLTPISGWHDWRQADTASIARNYAENNPNLLYPAIDWGGDTSGYVESEFQVYPYVVSVLYRCFGEHEALARLVSVFFSLVAIYGLFLLARDIMGRKAAYWSALVFAVLPLHVLLGRSVMPEATLLACSVLGVRFFYRWQVAGRVRDFWLSWCFLTLAVLIKLPTLYLGLPMVVTVLVVHGWRGFRDWKLWSLAALILLPVGLWYYHAHQLYLQTGLTFGIWVYGTDKWGNTDLLRDPDFYRRVFHTFLCKHTLTHYGYYAAALGLFFVRRPRTQFIVDAWLAGVLLYVLIVARGNYVHDYYQAPILIPAALLIARVLAGLTPGRFDPRDPAAYRVLAPALLVVLLFAASRTQVHAVLARESEDSGLLRMAAVVQDLSQPSERVIAVNRSNPAALYHARRRGWNAKSGDVNFGFISRRMDRGARLLYGEKQYFESIDAIHSLQDVALRYQLVHDAPEFFVVRLDPDPELVPVRFTHGWAAEESWGRWATDRTAGFCAAIPQAACDLSLLAAPRQVEQEPVRCRISCGDRELGTIVITGKPWDWRKYSLPVPPALSGRVSDFELHIDVPAAAADSESEDRLLAVKEVFLLPLETDEVAFDPQRRLTYLEGWHVREPWGRWGLAREATVRIIVPRWPAQLEITAAAWGQMDRVQRCRLTLAGETIGEIEISGEPWKMKPYTVDLPQPTPAGCQELRLSFEHSWPGSETDTRARTVALGGIAFIPIAE